MLTAWVILVWLWGKNCLSGHIWVCFNWVAPHTVHYFCTAGYNQSCVLRELPHRGTSFLWSLWPYGFIELLKQKQPCLVKLVYRPRLHSIVMLIVMGFFFFSFFSFFFFFIFYCIIFSFFVGALIGLSEKVCIINLYYYY